MLCSNAQIHRDPSTVAHATHTNTCSVAVCQSRLESQHFTMEPWWFPYTMPVVLSFQLLRLKIFKGLLLSLRHVLKFSFAAVSLLRQDFAVRYSLSCFIFFCCRCSCHSFSLRSDSFRAMVMPGSFSAGRRANVFKHVL